MIDSLPTEIAVQILSYLSYRDLIQASFVSRYWFSISQSDQLWKRQLYEHGWCAWINRQPQSQIIPLQDGLVTCLIFIDDRTLAVASEQSPVVIYRRTGKMYEQLHILNQHYGGVWVLKAYGDLLLSGGIDRAIRGFSIESGEQLFILEGHTSTIRCLEYIQEREIIVSGSRDSTLRVWKNDRSQAVLRGHSDSIRALACAYPLAVTASYDHTLRSWDLEVGQCVNIFAGHSDKVYNVAITNGLVISGSLDHQIRIWELKSGDCLKVLSSHSGLVGLIQIAHLAYIPKRLKSPLQRQQPVPLLGRQPYPLIISAAADSTVKLWSLQHIQQGLSSEPLATFHGSANAITTISHNHDIFIAGSVGSIRLYDLRHAHYIRDICVDIGSAWRTAMTDSQLVAAVEREGRPCLEIFDFGGKL